MRARGAVTGPLLLIGVGVLFLIHTISPDFRIDVIFGDYWPYFLIAWGLIQLVEIGVRVSRGLAIPAGGISGGGWAIALIICVLGWSTFEFRRADTWWRRAGFTHGAAMFGDERPYSVPTQNRTVGRHRHIFLEDFRGDAKISGVDGGEMSVKGQKTIRSLSRDESDHADQITPLEIVEQGDRWIIRCHQDRAGSKNVVTTNLELTVPDDSDVQAFGSHGDFDVSSLKGNFELKSANAGVSIRDVTGAVKIQTADSDNLHCAHVTGPVEIRGRGDDIDLADIGGTISISGDYSGSLAISRAAGTVHIETMRKQLTLAGIPGSIRLDRGEMEGDNLSGPIEMSAQSTDVSLRDWTGSLSLQVDRGDVSLDCAHIPTGRVQVRNASGDISATFPANASLRIQAHTAQGDIDNDFSSSGTEQTDGSGAHSERSSGGQGPEIELTSSRGDISVHKGDRKASIPPVPNIPPLPPVPPMHPKPPVGKRDIV